MFTQCSGCGTPLKLDDVLIYELTLSVKHSGCQDVYNDGTIIEWLDVTRSFCKQCFNNGKCVKEFRRIKTVFVEEAVKEKNDDNTDL